MRAAAVLELEPYLQRKPSQLSGGQRQRVAMGRALVREPKVFLFDEPLSNLDAQLRNQMRVEIKRLQRRLQTTTIYVTHDQIEAMTLADVIVVLKDGRIAQVGSPIEVFETPADLFVAGFIGTPQMNFFEGALARRGLDWRFENATLSLPVVAARYGDALVEGRRVWAGLRAEDLVPVGHGVRPKNAVTISGTVNLAEMLGSETLLFGVLGTESFVSRMQQPRIIEREEADVVRRQRRPASSLRSRKRGKPCRRRERPIWEVAYVHVQEIRGRRRGGRGAARRRRRRARRK